GNGQCYVQMVVTGTAGALTWTGTNGNSWDLGTTVNWLNAGNADVFSNLDTVTFNDTSANGGVNINGTVQPAIILVSNNVTSFTFSNGVIAGFTALVKSGPGLLSLNVSNGFTGGTTISGGEVDVNNQNALGTNKVSLNNATLYLNDASPANNLAVLGTNTLRITSQAGNTFPNFNLTGSGRLNLTIDGNSVFSPGGNWSAFSGYIYFTGVKSLRALSPNVSSANAIWDLGTGGGIYNKDGG
ncbi:MAG: autotransporter-associated beta strand repeat-containing protein, partial [Verrucomicrobia bacterium]|nr:autotransporter-associated beta strand repeat-containing protein [Verrucomicrobiota bacterium]